MKLCLEVVSYLPQRFLAGFIVVQIVYQCTLSCFKCSCHCSTLIPRSRPLETPARLVGTEACWTLDTSSAPSFSRIHLVNTAFKEMVNWGFESPVVNVLIIFTFKLFLLSFSYFHKPFIFTWNQKKAFSVSEYFSYCFSLSICCNGGQKIQTHCMLILYMNWTLLFPLSLVLWQRMTVDLWKKRRKRKTERKTKRMAQVVERLATIMT